MGKNFFLLDLLSLLEKVCSIIKKSSCKILSFFKQF